jgi:glutamate/tyrosine decarboxylase-like PLP-dependent enzyme
MANVAGFAVGVRHVLAAAGWDVDADGLFGAPEITVVVGEERHATVDRALRLLGLGKRHITAVSADEQGRMLPAALRDALGDRPTIVCAQAGNVNTGAFDPLREICGIAHEHDARVHVDGAFGLWAAATPSLRHLLDGVGLADSWATDAHKWFNVPYDCGIVLCATPTATGRQ